MVQRRTKKSANVSSAEIFGTPGANIGGRMKTQTTPEAAVPQPEQILMWKGVPVREMLAVPLAVACQLLGIGRTSLWKEISIGRIRKTPLNTIAKAELERYLEAVSAAPA